MNRFSALYAALCMACLLGCGNGDDVSLETKGRDLAEHRPAFVSPQGNALMRRIHADLTNLVETSEWFRGYDDKALGNHGGAVFISFYPAPGSVPGGETIEMTAQQPDHVSISYIPLSAPRHMKYWNVVEDEEACTFHDMGFKIYAEVLISGENTAGLRQKVQEIVVARCRELGKEK